MLGNIRTKAQNIAHEVREHNINSVPFSLNQFICCDNAAAEVGASGGVEWSLRRGAEMSVQVRLRRENADEAASSGGHSDEV